MALIRTFTLESPPGSPGAETQHTCPCLSLLAKGTLCVAAFGAEGRHRGPVRGFLPTPTAGFRPHLGHKGHGHNPPGSCGSGWWVTTRASGSATLETNVSKIGRGLMTLYKDTITIMIYVISVCPRKNSWLTSSCK